ncbi:hypothetical protein ACSNOK_09160, partial [Streptomyces sp. URMC 126]
RPAPAAPPSLPTPSSPASPPPAESHPPAPIPPVHTPVPPHHIYRKAVTMQGNPLTPHTSVITLTLLLTTPAVLTAALLRPRSGSRRNR